MINNENHQVDVLAAFKIQPHVSTRMISRQMDISHSSVYHILKDNSYHPYKIHYVQGLRLSDPNRRLIFLLKIAMLCEEDEYIFF